jgi:bifunctional non-homologous end joining protein LigD
LAVTQIVTSILDQLDQPYVSQLQVGDVHVSVSHLDRVLWPATDGYPAITKRDLLKYFTQLADHLLHHLRDRPLTLNRYPTGIAGKHFFQKHVETKLPPYVERECLYAEQHASSGYYVICNNLPTLLWLGQIANLELHPWHSRRTSEPDARRLPHTFSGSIEELEASVLNYPDFMVFDLDPYLYSGREKRGGEPLLHREGFLKTCEAAFWLKDVLDQLELRAFVKTSGKSGLHIVVPILRQFDYDTVRRMSEHICRHVVRQQPAELTMEWSVERRRGKVFLDYNQNTRGKTLASAYSPRAVAGAPVSTPIDWSELEHIYPTDFTLLNIRARLERVGDLWHDILVAKNDLTSHLQRELQ